MKTIIDFFTNFNHLTGFAVVVILLIAIVVTVWIDRRERKKLEEKYL